MPGKNIVVLGTMDTKGREMRWVKTELGKHGQAAILVDTGVINPPNGAPNITRDEVIRAAGEDLSELMKNPTRDVIAPLMAKGATSIVQRLIDQGQIHGIISLGGTQGTTLATTVMRALPFGFPKVMVSTMASGDVGPFVDIKDITMMFPVTDILGLNPVSRKVLSNAAGAVAGMADSDINIERAVKPLVGVTTVGITTEGAMKAIEVLEENGCETIVFHAVGTGGRSMEELIRQGIIIAVLDIATIEVANEMYDAMLAGGPDRLTVAAGLGLPQVICPGAIAILVYGEPSSVPPPFNTRKLIPHSPLITDVRLNKDEQVAVAKELAKRLQGNTGPCTFMIPRDGFDSYSAVGQGFYDPAADAAFIDALKADLPSSVKVIERDTHIDDPAFATEIALTLVAQMKRAGILA